MKQSRTLWGSWACKPFRQLLISEGGDIETREGQPRDNSAAWGQDPGSTSRDTHNNKLLKTPAFFIPDKTT